MTNLQLLSKYQTKSNYKKRIYVDNYKKMLDNKHMKILKKLIIIVILIVTLFLLTTTFLGYAFYKKTVSKMPITAKITEVRNEFTYVKKEQLPQYYLDAVIAVEDRRFYSHGPVDYIGIARAIISNIENKSIQEGGSTITQQVAKNLYYIDNNKNSFIRKIAEIFTAIDLEKSYQKDEILELYVNIIFFGNGYYGIKEATEGYLKKEPEDINLSEATMLAGIPNAPSVYAPNVNKELCKSRQKKVISSMLENNYITNEEAEEIDQTFIDNIE